MTSPVVRSYSSVSGPQLRWAPQCITGPGFRHRATTSSRRRSRWALLPAWPTGAPFHVDRRRPPDVARRSRRRRPRGLPHFRRCHQTNRVRRHRADHRDITCVRGRRRTCSPSLCRPVHWRRNRLGAAFRDHSVRTANRYPALSRRYRLLRPSTEPRRRRRARNQLLDQRRIPVADVAGCASITIVAIRTRVPTPTRVRCSHWSLRSASSP